MKRLRPGRRPAAPAVLDDADARRLVEMLTEAWLAASCEYRRADVEGRQHLWHVMDRITDAVNTLEGR